MAQSSSVNRYPFDTMTLTGQGFVVTAPDLAVIRLGVQTTGYDIPQIQTENAQITEMVIRALKKAGVTEIKTIQYAIDKMYEYEDGKQIENGYTVRNSLEIKTNDLDHVGAIIDAAVNMGANIVTSVSFELTEPQLYYQHALNLAMDNAIQKAKSISTNLRVRLNPVPIRIIEGSTSPVPSQQLQRSFATTPIIPGELRIDAFVTADFSYSK